MIVQNLPLAARSIGGGLDTVGADDRGTKERRAMNSGGSGIDRDVET